MTMKKYVVGILSMSDYELKLFKVVSKNPYEAVKKGMVGFCSDEEAKKYELEWQSSEDYPKNYEQLSYYYEYKSFNVIEVLEF